VRVVPKNVISIRSTALPLVVHHWRA